MITISYSCQSKYTHLYEKNVNFNKEIKLGKYKIKIFKDQIKKEELLIKQFRYILNLISSFYKSLIYLIFLV